VLESGSHILAVYPNKNKEIDDAIHFLKIGLDSNEVVLLIIDENINKESIQKKVQSKYGIDQDEINKLQDKGDISIVTSSEWYLLSDNNSDRNGSKDKDRDAHTTKLRIDKKRVMQSWITLVNNAITRKKTGVRVFASTSYLFELGLAKQFLDYEMMLPSKFDFPITAICAHQASDISSHMSSEEIRNLSLHHSYTRIGDKYEDVIENPPSNGHIAVLYDSNNGRDKLATDYINEGLKRKQLCVYASLQCHSDSHLREIKSKIIDFDNNVRDGNLIIIDLSTHYVAAMTNDLNPFDKLKDDIIQKTKDRQDKHVRLVADCAPFLYQNKHFDECVDVEAWWHKRPVKEGSVLCPYRKSLIDTFPYDYYRYRVFANHDTIIDENAQIVGSFVWRQPVAAPNHKPG
jgi:hypothetical protein